mmetsp:Transcript_48247/g.86998  ORF Transcript_48247/g.86998 Transcript_48247/m.86998 type:complete len:240 (-) Transcript_48247:319-1038(-)
MMFEALHQSQEELLVALQSWSYVFQAAEVAFGCSEHELRISAEIGRSIAQGLPISDDAVEFNSAPHGPQQHLILLQVFSCIAQGLGVLPNRLLDEVSVSPQCLCCISNSPSIFLHKFKHEGGNTPPLLSQVFQVADVITHLESLEEAFLVACVLQARCHGLLVTTRKLPGAPGPLSNSEICEAPAATNCRLRITHIRCCSIAIYLHVLRTLREASLQLCRRLIFPCHPLPWLSGRAENV